MKKYIIYIHHMNTELILKLMREREGINNHTQACTHSFIQIIVSACAVHMVHSPAGEMHVCNFDTSTEMVIHISYL